MDRDKPINSPCWRYVREIPQDTEITIPRRIFDEFAMLDSDYSRGLISSSNNGTLIKKSDHGKADLSVAADSHPQSGFQKLYKKMELDRVTPDVQFWMFAHLNSPRLVKCMISRRWQMKLKDINAEITFELWLIPELSGETPNIGIGYIEPNNTGQAYRLRIDGQQWSVQLRDPSAGKDLNFHLKRGCAHLAEVMQVAKDGSALVKIIFFKW